MQGFLQQNRWHVACVLLIVVVQFFIKDLSAAWYRQVSRPQLVAQGYRSCAGFKPSMPRYMPADCDLVRVDRSSDRVDERYVTSGGAVEYDAHSIGGNWAGTSFVMHANIGSLWIPGVAFVLFGLSVLLKMARTRKLMTWSLAAEPNSRFETLLRLYALPVFLASVLFGLMGR